MENLKSHIREIDKDYSNLIYSLYMKGFWGISVGYKVPTPYMTMLHKKLVDYQILSEPDCTNDLFIASQGSVSYNCCPEGSTKVQVVSANKCCPAGYNYNGPGVYSQYPDGVCVAYAPTVGFVTPVTCPCCPIGYVYQNSTGVCQGASASDVVDPIDCGYKCLSATGIYTDLIACPDLVPDSTVLIYPTVDPCNDTCYNGVTWCNITPAPIVVNRVITIQGSNVAIEQYPVGDTGGPVAGTTTFTPSPSLIGKTVNVAMRVLLDAGDDYTFNTTTGTITLLGGRLFNTGETYTIFSY